MTTQTIPDHLPPNPVARTALTALAMFFDERHVERAKVADDFREATPAEYPEQHAIASTWQHAANVTWEMCGGRPNNSFAQCDHLVKISARELGKLIEMGTRPSHGPLVQPSRNPCKFDEGLVERLARIATDARQTAGTWDAWEIEKKIVCAILSELASTLVELPTTDEIAIMCGRDLTKSMTPYDAGERRGINTTLEAVGARIAPILAAKDARIAEQDRQLDIAARLMSVEREANSKRIAELEKRLAEQSAPVDATGKTPGQVDFEGATMAHFGNIHPAHTWESLEAPVKRSYEAGAQAVLRAFGNGVEVLRRVRERIEERFSSMHDYGVRCEAREIIDDEFAKLPSGPSAPQVAHPGRVFVGITFERELPDGSRENIDPSTVRLIVGDDATQLVPVGLGGKTP